MIRHARSERGIPRRTSPAHHACQASAPLHGARGTHASGQTAVEYLMVCAAAIAIVAGAIQLANPLVSQFLVNTGPAVAQPYP